MATIFGRLRRYAFTPGRDAREDRLTEALAATLEAAPDAARALTKAFFVDEQVEWERLGAPRIATQRRTDAGDRIDLQISFGQEARPDFTAWIEAKVDARPERAQAERYLDAASRAGGTRVCWLLPVGTTVRGGSPDAVPVRTWQELAVTLHNWHESVPQDQRHEHGASLVSESIRHLEEEEVLAATQPFNPEDATAINQFPRSTAKLETILRDAQKYLHAEWGAL